jgi:uncharacterized protein YkwD
LAATDPAPSELAGATAPIEAGTSEAGAATVSARERLVVALTNAERLAAGCPRLVWDDRLALAAERHARDMVRWDYFEHVSPRGLGPVDRVREAGFFGGVGENLAVGYVTAPDAVHGWMQSPGHRANIVECRFTAIGVSYLDQVIWSKAARGVWVQEFGAGAAGGEPAPASAGPAPGVGGIEMGALVFGLPPSGWHNSLVVVSGRDEKPDAPPSAQDPGGPVADLWSLPPGAFNLDEALIDDDAALDRLAAVLPVLGPDLEPDQLDPGWPVASGGGSSGHDASAGSRSGRRTRREIRGDSSGRGKLSLSAVSVLLLLVIVYAASTVLALAWKAMTGAESATAGRSDTVVVVDGPPPCPMYRDPRSTVAASSGTCFFVG